MELFVNYSCLESAPGYGTSLEHVFDGDSGFGSFQVELLELAPLLELILPLVQIPPLRAFQRSLLKESSFQTAESFAR